MGNRTERRTSNVEHRTSNQCPVYSSIRCSAFEVRCSTFARCIGRASARFAILLLVTGTMCRSAPAQPPLVRYGDLVPRDVREMYDRGLQYLANSQTEAGNWNGGDVGPGGTGLGLMVFLASGEDPNFGLYSNHVRRALRSIISSQDGATGFLGQSMYHHGFGMLGLAEAYGAVDERNLWPDRKSQRSVGQALELAVRAAITSQKKNSQGAWRYSPNSTDADTSVSGAVLVGLLAARNAGIEVPDESIEKAITYYTKMTSPSGQVGYSGGFGGFDESPAHICTRPPLYARTRPRA